MLNRAQGKTVALLKPTIRNTAILSQSHWLQLPERVYKLKPESDLTPIPVILKPQHYAADEEPDLS